MAPNPVLPEAGKKNVLITSALPYVNNIPHLGMSSFFVPLIACCAETGERESGETGVTFGVISDRLSTWKMTAKYSSALEKIFVKMSGNLRCSVSTSGS